MAGCYGGGGGVVGVGAGTGAVGAAIGGAVGSAGSVGGPGPGPGPASGRRKWRDRDGVVRQSVGSHRVPRAGWPADAGPMPAPDVAAALVVVERVLAMRWKQEARSRVRLVARWLARRRRWPAWAYAVAPLAAGLESRAAATQIEARQLDTARLRLREALVRPGCSKVHVRESWNAVYRTFAHLWSTVSWSTAASVAGRWVGWPAGWRPPARWLVSSLDAWYFSGGAQQLLRLPIRPHRRHRFTIP